MRVENKITIVTGSGQGIGFGIAERLAEEGAVVIINDVNEENAKKAVETIEKNGGKADSFIADVSKKDQVEAMVAATLEKHGRIDILVNNTGVLRDNYIQNMSEEDWDFVIDVNLKGTFFCMQAASAPMREQKYGKICSISSRAYLGNRGQANYSASKGGIVSLTRAMAIELARFKINVNAVAPGLIDTPLIQSLRKDIIEELERKQPMGQAGTTRDIANAVLFLVSDESEFVTGQCLLVDGGKSLGGSAV